MWLIAITRDDEANGIVVGRVLEASKDGDGLALNAISARLIVGFIGFGIGNDFGRGQQVGYVLGGLSEEENEQMPEICKRVIEGIKAWATIGPDRAMNTVNTKPKQA